MKVSELEGAELDYWVGKALGFNVRLHPELGAIRLADFAAGIPHSYVTLRYSTDWSQGGPIIERERIQLGIDVMGTWMAGVMRNGVMSWNSGNPTALIAAMRCFVASKFGETVQCEPSGRDG